MVSKGEERTSPEISDISESGRAPLPSYWRNVNRQHQEHLISPAGQNKSRRRFAHIEQTRPRRPPSPNNYSPPWRQR